MKDKRTYCKKKGTPTTEVGEFGFVTGRHKGCAKQCFDCMADVGERLRDGNDPEQQQYDGGGIAFLMNGETYLGSVERGVNPQLKEYMRNYPNVFFRVADAGRFSSMAIKQIKENIEVIQRFEREQKWYMKVFRKLQSIWK